jgi:hypothetical protein
MEFAALNLSYGLQDRLRHDACRIPAQFASAKERAYKRADSFIVRATAGPAWSIRRT